MNIEYIRGFCINTWINTLVVNSREAVHLPLLEPHVVGRQRLLLVGLHGAAVQPVQLLLHGVPLPAAGGLPVQGPRAACRAVGAGACATAAGAELGVIAAATLAARCLVGHGLVQWWHLIRAAVPLVVPGGAGGGDALEQRRECCVVRCDLQRRCARDARLQGESATSKIQSTNERYAVEMSLLSGSTCRSAMREYSCRARVMSPATAAPLSSALYTYGCPASTPGTAHMEG